MSTTSTTFTYSNHIVVDASTNVDISCHHIHCSSYIGEIKIWYSESSIPDGFLLCDGSLCNVTAYPALAAALGHTSGNFYLPDFKDYFIRGRGTNNTDYSDLSFGSDTLTSNHLPKHSLNITGISLQNTRTNNYIKINHNHSSTTSAHTHPVRHTHNHGSVQFNTPTVSDVSHSHTYTVWKSEHNIPGGSSYNTADIFEWNINGDGANGQGGGTALFSGMQYYQRYPDHAVGNYTVNASPGWNDRNNNKPWNVIRDAIFENWSSSNINGNHVVPKKSANDYWGGVDLVHSSDAAEFFGGANHGYYRDNDAPPFNIFRHTHSLINGNIGALTDATENSENSSNGGHSHSFNHSNASMSVGNSSLIINSNTNSNNTTQSASITGSSNKSHSHSYTITVNSNILNKNTTNQDNFIPKHNYVVYIIRWK